jgi:hypothetical protein
MCSWPAMEPSENSRLTADAPGFLSFEPITRPLVLLVQYAHTDPANLDAMEAHIDGLLQERCRAMGLAESEEICRIELEIAAAANDEIAEEIREFRRKVRGWLTASS